MATKYEIGQKMATGIFWRGEGTFSIQVSIGKRESGKSYYEKHCETFKGTLEEAKTRRAQLIIDHAEGRLKPVDKHKTFGSYAELYFEHNRRRVEMDRIALSTAEYYEDAIKRNFAHLWDDLLAKITANDIIKVFSALKKDGRTTDYMMSIFRAFRAMWRSSKKLKTPVPDVLDDIVEMLPIPVKIHRVVYTPDQLKLLLAAVEDDPITHGIITCLIHSLCRIGEVLALGRQDVDIEDKRIIITRQALKKPDADGNRFGPHKTFRTHGPRVIRMTDTLAEELLRLRPVLAAMKLRAGGEWQDHGLFFPTSVGTPHYYSSWESRFWLPIFERTGLPRIRVHDIRHSAITYLLSEGIPLTTVQEIAGHADIRTTMGYKHMILKAQDKAMRQMDKAMR